MSDRLEVSPDRNHTAKQPDQRPEQHDHQHRRIKLQRHGQKARDWLLWRKQNRGRSRTEWLFGALTSGDRDLRLHAANELRGVAATPISYSADLPEEERVSAAQAWQRWFQKGGHRL